MKKIAILCLALGFTARAQEDGPKIHVVTTLSFMRHAAEKIGGDRVTTCALHSPRRDPHCVAADPEMQKQAARADLFIYLGRGLDLWYKDVLQNSGNMKIQAGKGLLMASSGCSVLELPKVLSKEWGDIHPEGNPHVWLDPLNFKQIARNVCEALCGVDPAGKKAYEENLRKYEEGIDAAMFGKELLAEEDGDTLWRKLRLGKLDGYLKEEKLESKLGGWLKKARPLKGLKVVSYHKTYVYFAERFGFEIAGELEEKPGIEPSPQQRDAVVELVTRQGVKIILNDVFYPTRAAEYVASKTGAKVVVVPIDVNGVDGVDSYLGMIDHILDMMAEAAK